MAISMNNQAPSSPVADRSRPAEQREIQAIMKQVQDKVMQLACGDPNLKFEQVLDIDGVIGYIERMQHEKAERKNSDKFSAFKGIVNRTLQCIQTVGGIIASGVSDVFAPTALAYNALTFVISAWQNYEGMFENLSELLEKCVEFLERLEYYEGSMDLKLTRLACQNLQLFVEVCDRTIRLRKKRHRFEGFMKQLFLNDNGISGLLGMMDKLNGKETRLVNAQTYKIVSDSAGDIKMILDTQKDQKKDDDAKKWRKAIAKVLGFPNTEIGTDGEPIPTWQRAFDARQNALVEQTGQWILEEGFFSDWAASICPTKPMILLEGDNGTGKTSMMANVIRTIRKKDQGGPTSRIVTAYFFPEAGGRKPRADDGSFLETVSRTLLWQVSTAYEAMARSVASIAEKRRYFEGSVDLWQRLFLQNKERKNSDTTFYLFIDSADIDARAIMPLLQRLLTEDVEKKVRIFLTARPSTITLLFNQARGLDCHIAPITDYNGQDIDSYINYRLDNMSIFGDSGRPGIKPWRTKVVEKLTSSCRGDYFTLNTSLDALAKVDLIEDINKVLESAGKTRTDQIDAEIRRLNSDRTPKEIQEINEIILWIDSGRRWLSVDMMEAILGVKHRVRSLAARKTTNDTGSMATMNGKTEAVPDSPGSAMMTISLLPLSQKLREKYPLFTITDSERVDWRSSEIKDRIPLKSPGIQARTGPQIIHENEITIVRHFLSNVCPPDLYQRFDFQSFLDGKLGAGQKDFISFDKDNADLSIAITCLMVLTNRELREDKKLRRYSMCWILEHLQGVDFSLADRDLKRQIGPLLFRFFTDGVGIDSMFWSFDLSVSQQKWLSDESTFLAEARREWVYSMNGVQEAARWLKDSSVTQDMASEDMKQFVAKVKISEANLHEAVLMDSAKHMADHLFRRAEYLPRMFQASCCFLRAFLARLDPSRASGMPSNSDDPKYVKDAKELRGYDSTEFELDQIQEIESWASKVLHHSEDDVKQQSRWEIHASLIIFQLCSSKANAKEVYMERARRAVELDPSNWHACHFVSMQRMTNDQDAVDMLSRAKQDLDKLWNEEAWTKNRDNTAIIARITLELGDRLWDLGQDYDQAARTHRESLEYHYARFRAYAKVIDRYQKRQAWHEVIAFVATLTRYESIWGTYTDELSSDFIIHQSILSQAADITGRWDVIETFFNHAIDLASKQGAHETVFVMRDAFAKTLEDAVAANHQDKVVRLREVALQEIRNYPSENLPRSVIRAMSDALAVAYLDRAMGLPLDKAQYYGNLLAGLVPESDENSQDVWLNMTPACSLIRYHARLGTESQCKLAQVWKRKIIQVSIELLTDDDEDNDSSAYWVLARLLASLGDKENTLIAWALRNMDAYKSQMKWESSLASNETPLAKGDDQNSGSETEPIMVLRRVKPSRRSTNGSEKSLGGEPQDFVDCDGCHKSWAVMAVPLYTCADCTGLTQLCQDCCEILGKGELKQEKGLSCRKEHLESLILIPQWQPEQMQGTSDGRVHWTGNKDDDSISLDEWKGRLKSKYL